MCRRMQAFVGAVCAVVAIWAGCAGGALAQDAAGVTVLGEARSLQHDGLERVFWIERPAHVSAPAPLVILLHGGGTADGRSTLRWGFQPLAARDGVVTAHPSGQGEGWNDGRVTQFLYDRQGGAVDDVGFLVAMIDQLVRDGLVDRDHVYLVGGSNGGMMTLRMACEARGRISAVAVFIANFPEGAPGRCEPGAPLSILLLSGDQDPLMPFAGGEVAAVARGDRGRVISSDETASWWRRFNQCEEPPAVAQLPDVDRDDGTRIREERSSRCAGGVEVTRIVVQGGGHRLPSLNAATLSGPRGRLLGAGSRDLDGVAYIWAFFVRHGLTAGSAAEAQP